MKVDVLRLKAGARVKMKDGEVGKVRGSYMSTTGIILTVQTNPSSCVDRNVPLEDIEEVIQDAGD